MARRKSKKKNDTRAKVVGVLALFIIVAAFVLYCASLESCGDKDDKESTTNIEETTKDKDETTEEAREDSTENNESTTESAKESSSETTREEPSSLETTKVKLDKNWEFAGFSEINSGSCRLYRASKNRKGIIVGVNAGHGTSGGSSAKTYCHPDKSPRVTGGSTAKGAIKATAVTTGMDFIDGSTEAEATLIAANLLKEELLNRGYDVLMVRDSDDVQLDNVARTVICNNTCDCHISLHFDGDDLDYDKGCFFLSVPSDKSYRAMYPVANVWKKSNSLGETIIAKLKKAGCKIYKNGQIEEDLIQTSYSKIPSVDLELGNQFSSHGKKSLSKAVSGIAEGINAYFKG